MDFRERGGRPTAVRTLSQKNVPRAAPDRRLGKVPVFGESSRPRDGVLGIRDGYLRRQGEFVIEFDNDLIFFFGT